jgi:hypothetical protein
MNSNYAIKMEERTRKLYRRRGKYITPDLDYF